jgi:hypothetical protein
VLLQPRHASFNRRGPRSSSGSWALLAAMRRASSLVIGVMLSFAHVLDRVWSQASLTIGLTFGVAWIGALGYGLLRLW